MFCDLVDSTALSARLDPEELREVVQAYQKTGMEVVRRYDGQDAAYQSLLKSTRQKYHQQIAQVLEERFLETKETQPELLAHHYTEAGLIAQAIPYWQQAGQKAVQRSANAEARSHLAKSLELLNVLPETLERNEQELSLQITLGSALMAVKGLAAPETERTYTRARELCQQVGETPQLLPILYALCGSYTNRAELLMARELGEQLLSLALSIQDSSPLTAAHFALGQTLFWLGEFALARGHVEQGIALYRLRHQRLARGEDPVGRACVNIETLEEKVRQGRYII
jgi:tetratricopeptide (TPR) repeat protein